MYKVTNKIIDGTKELWYRLEDNQGNIFYMSKDDVIKEAMLGRVVNLRYNKSTNGLSGVGIDLRSLPVINKNAGRNNGVLNRNKKVSSRCISKKKIDKGISSKDDKIENNKKYSNQELAEQYKKKCSLLGIEFNLVLEYLDGDRVRLLGVKNKRDTGRLVIPSFVTDFIPIKVSRNAERVIHGALLGCKFTEVYVDNSGDRDINVSGLCAGMESEELKVVFRHPERIINTKYMFSGCRSLVKLDISGLRLKKVKCMHDMFSWCLSLEELDLKSFDVGIVTDMRRMFYNCCSLKYLDTDTWCGEKVKDASYMFANCRRLVGLDFYGFDLRGADRTDLLVNCTDLWSSTSYGKLNISGLYYK